MKKSVNNLMFHVGIRIGIKRTYLVALSVLALLLGLAAQAPQVYAQGSKPLAVRSSSILVLGDSISAEYGLPRGSGWVNIMGQSLKDKGVQATIQNASISGETSAGAVSRIDDLLKRFKPTLVVIELGGNDALRGLPVAKTEQNLTTLITKSQQAGAKVVVVGIRIPPNYGRSYTTAFEGLFAALAKKYQTALVPFIFEGLQDTPEYFQADRIHPTVKAQPIMAGNIAPVVLRALAK